MEDNEHESGLIKDNLNNFCARPTLALAKVAFLPTIKTIWVQQWKQFLAAEQCWRSGIVVSVVFNIRYILFVFLLSRSIAESIMAKVEYAFPVEVIHGKVAKRHKIGFAHRKASKLNYTQSYSPRSTRYSQAEKDHQAKFAAVAAMVNARLADPNQMPLDQLAFKGQSKYKTLRQYVWHICSEEYDKQNA